MKTYKRLYPKIYEFENLYWAFRKARKGKRNRPDVAAFEFNLEFELPRLQEELASETYRPGPYRHFTLYERKPRRISAAPFRDRVAHHALCNVIEPIWEARFIHDSLRSVPEAQRSGIACRVGKGTHAALDRCTYFSRRSPAPPRRSACGAGVAGGAYYCILVKGHRRARIEGGTENPPIPPVGGSLTKLRAYLRLCRDLQLLSIKQYGYASQQVAQVGRLLGGWFKSLEGKIGSGDRERRSRDRPRRKAVPAS